MNVIMVIAMMTSSYLITAVSVIVDDKTVKFSRKKKCFSFSYKNSKSKKDFESQQ